MAAPTSVGVRKFNYFVKAHGFIHRSVSSLTATTTCKPGEHSGRTNMLNAVAGFATTLPAATGSGNRYRFIVGTTLTSGTYVIKVANATDVFVGGAFANDVGDSTAATVDYNATASTSDTYTMTQSIGGGKKGDWFECEDIAAGFWFVNGVQQGIVDPTSPFSASVS